MFTMTDFGVASTRVPSCCDGNAWPGTFAGLCGCNVEGGSEGRGELDSWDRGEEIQRFNVKWWTEAGH